MSSSLTPVPNLLHFLESVPPPVTLLLVELAPVISGLRYAAEVISWKSDWTDPWLALAGWWALCLSTNVVLRYFLPAFVLLPALLPFLQVTRGTPVQSPPTTEHTISLALSNLTIIQSLVPVFPQPPTLPLATALRLTALFIPPYILLTYLVPMPILVGIMGTLVLTHRAPWVRTTRAILWRSAYVRRFLLRLWTIISGTTHPSLTPSVVTHPHATLASTSQAPLASAPTSAPIRFLFTILECQRWWMGLDWTAALLPGERPSWCGVSHHPVPPPSAFGLPPPTSVYLSAPHGRRVKRTATWRWEDGEWGIMVNKDGTEAKRVEKKPPGIEGEEGGARIATKAATILKERKASMSSSPEQGSGKEERDSGMSGSAGSGPEGDGGDFATDADGWVYGDNKWENTSAKGGMGKYTRYRRWTRIAVLEETVQEVEPGEVGIIEEQKDAADARGRGNAPQGPESPTKGPNSLEEGGEGGKRLRQRLKTA